MKGVRLASLTLAAGFGLTFGTVGIAPTAQAVTTTGFSKECHSYKTKSEVVITGEWRKTSKTITVQRFMILNQSTRVFNVTRVRLTDETTGKYVNGETGPIASFHSSKPWSPAKTFPRKHKIVLQVKGYMKPDSTDTVGCGARP